ncbi:hypothetical protein QBC47DRAFT_460156 [Echria macrotheca]|uniref:HNH nuclease domain-containing protein n=1 Tax=Echria macrotheca TaxID=438768 RepID=A0AAJ0BFJ9_9PEZI|nr:hypothetical protein QBC47DRAFT_460156 [Echria macrotheca]
MEPDRALPAGQPQAIIQVEFVGNYPIAWEPLAPAPGESQSSDSSQLSDLSSKMFDSQATVSDSGFPSTNEELKQQFVAYIEERMRGARGDSEAEAEFCDPEIDQMDMLKGYHSLLAIVHDPTSALQATDTTKLKRYMEDYNLKYLETAFYNLCGFYLAQIDKLGKLWNEKNKRDPAHAEKDCGDDNVDESRKGKSSSPAKRRKLATTGASNVKPDRLKPDREAQKIVPCWYNKMCTLTGGTFLVEAAHIIDVRVTTKLGADKDAKAIWAMLTLFWPLEDLKALTISGDEQRNILPLRIDAHRLWDDHRFALRPVEHPTDPTHRLYLQMVWLKDITTEDNLARSPWDHRKNGTITDFRRGSGDDDTTFPAIRHGDVYELVTADEAACPLPNMHFLRLRYAMQKLLAGMMAAGALKDVFRGPPPPPSGMEGPVRDERHMPGDWEMLIEAAQQEGVLTVEAAERWRRYILENAYQEYQERVEEYAAWRAEKGM